MKSITISYKKNIILTSDIILIALVLTLGFYSLCNSGEMDPCEGGNYCGEESSVRVLDSYAYFQIPILNNHHPTIANITQVHVEVPAVPCEEEQYEDPDSHHNRCRCNVDTETRLKEIKFGDTVALSKSSSYCVCTDSADHTGHTFSLDTNYSFSDAKVLCTITLDVETAPSGLYTVIYYYTLPGDETERSNELTFTIP